MIRFKGIYILLAAGLLSLAYAGKEDKRTIRFADLGWTIEVPANTRFRDSSFDAAGRLRPGLLPLQEDEAVWLFSIGNDNICEMAFVIRKDTLGAHKWDSVQAAYNKTYFKQLEEVRLIKVSGKSYDTVIIGGTLFRKQVVKYTGRDSDGEITVVHYYGLAKGYDIEIKWECNKAALSSTYEAIAASLRFDP